MLRLTGSGSAWQAVYGQPASAFGPLRWVWRPHTVCQRLLLLPQLLLLPLLMALKRSVLQLLLLQLVLLLVWLQVAADQAQSVFVLLRDPQTPVWGLWLLLQLPLGWGN